MVAPVLAVGAALMFAIAPTVNAGISEFPANHEGYHTYAETNAELGAVVARYGQGTGAIVKRFLIGKSTEGRDIWALKISDRVATDENEPEVLAEANMHAREHITVEMALYMIHLLTDNYGGSDALGQRVTNIVNTREIWVIPQVNPDGAEWDIKDGTFHNWRKDRFDNPKSACMGIDINRNFGFMWGMKGSSAKPCDGGYRGQFAYQSVEARVLRDFMLSRRINGRQQIKAVFNWHSFGEFVMWPYGYTKEDVPPTMTVDDHEAFVALGGMMASLNGYRARQGSDSYIYSGDFPAWAYGAQRTFVFTLEMYPAWDCTGCGGFYPSDTVIERETTRNTETVLYLLEQADCPYRAAGLARTNCGPLYDNFEIGSGWSVNPSGADSATDGAWQRGIPEATTDASGLKQRADVTSGRAAFSTGRTAGASVAANDVDGGTTSLRSPQFNLGSGEWRLTFNYTFGHDAAASASDFVRVSVLSGGVKTVVWSVAGDGADVNATWGDAVVTLNAWQGKKVRLLFQAADGGSDNLVEAAIDDVRVYQP
jgi:carboxypeptidase T